MAGKNLPAPTAELLTNARRLLDAAGLDSTSRSLWDQAFERAVSRVYYGIALSDGALRGASGACDQTLLDALAELAKRRVFVFCLTTDEKLQRQIEGIHLPRFLTLLPDWKTYVRRLEEEGVRVERVLRVSLTDESAILIPGEGWKPRAEIPPAFVPAPKAVSPGSFPTFAQDIPTWGAPEPLAAFELLPVPGDQGPLPAPDAVLRILECLRFSCRINVSESAADIRPPSDGPMAAENAPILAKFAALRKVAEANLLQGKETLQRQLRERLRVDCLAAWFDPRSGGIYFLPDEWRRLRFESQPEPEKHQTELRKGLFEFFDSGLPNFWQRDRPSKLRVLYTSTKVLLRGEQYYASLRNVSPFERIDMMWQEFNSLQAVWGQIVPRLDPARLRDNPLEVDERKLLLAYFDQLRNIALQTLSFVHAGPPLFREIPEATALANDFEHLFGDEAHDVHKLVHQVLSAYYQCLLARDEAAVASTRAAFEAWGGLRERLERLKASVAAFVRGRNLSVGSLVRRWREADSPFENVLTALAAATKAEEDRVLAVGIGWGGIELPLLFRILRRECFDKTHDICLIARWSHYRKTKRPPELDVFPRGKGGPELLNGANVVLFDDNALTGITLQTVRDELLLRGAADVRMYVGRYSGERRAAQMQMPDHGAVDPELFGTEIAGFLGETPFARSWSTEEYENPIGIFSLSKRRILEYIHSNSTVNLYDREGF